MQLDDERKLESLEIQNVSGVDKVQNALLAKKKQLIQFCFQNNILVDPIFLAGISEIDLDKIYFFLSKNSKVKVLNKKTYQSITDNKKTNSRVDILSCYNEESKKRSEQDFISYFNARYNSISKLLKNRSDMQNLMSINRVSFKKDKVALIGMVFEKRVTKNNNIILTLEDNTGRINVMITRTKK
ncbi:unnamed protein product, partial [marine sediment metagenome]